MAYPGGKSGAGIYQRIVNLMPPHDTYIEPFLGGAAVMRMKRPARLNVGLDLDAAVVDRASLELARGSRSGSGSAGNDDGDRRISPFPAIPADPARNGEARWGVATIAEKGDSSGIIDVSGDTAADWRFLRQDGIQHLIHLKPRPGVLIYCDPPYLMSTRSGRRMYKHEMSDVHHRRLLRCCRSLSWARVMISGYWSQMYAEELTGWNSIHYEAMTRSGRTATEWLWFNFPPPVALHDYRYLGNNFRERERIKRKKLRWTARLKRMPLLERQALLCAIDESRDTPDSRAAGISQMAIKG